MAAGPLRDRVTFERLNAATDDLGNTDDATWNALFTVWGGLKFAGGGEQSEGGRVESQISGELRVRSTAATRGITAADRVRIDELIYQIRTVVNRDRRDRFLILGVERGVAV